MSGIVHHNAELDEVRIHFVTAGSGPPLVLLHGWPQTWFAWRHMVAELSADYHLIMPDLRGLGASSRPAGGYDKKTVAQDVLEVVRRHIGNDAFYLAGHDWGGAVAFALAANDPAAVRRLAIVDMAIPKGDVGSVNQGGRRWHHRFHHTPELPEALIDGREDIYLRWFFRTFAARPDAIPEEDIAEYVRAYRGHDALRAGFEYYRATEQDIEDNRHYPTLPMPVLALGGACSWGRGLEVLESLSGLAGNVEGGVIEDAGHWIPEEQPAALAARFRAFFVDS